MPEKKLRALNHNAAGRECLRTASRAGHPEMAAHSYFDLYHLALMALNK
jgi:hypothetical protein